MWLELFFMCKSKLLRKEDPVTINLRKTIAMFVVAILLVCVFSVGFNQLLGWRYVAHARVNTAQAAPTQLGPWNHSITFPDGVPVGGWANLTLFSNGAYNFSGHFHVSGALSYDTAIVWAVKSSDGSVYLFTHSGRVHGTFESGSRDDNWNDAGTNPALAAGWTTITKRWSYRSSARVDMAIGPLIDDVKSVIGAAGAVIAIV